MIGDLSTYAACKDSGIPWLGEVPVHWAVRKLKHAVSFSGGGTPSKANASFWNGHIPWVSPKDMRTPMIADTTDHITEAAVAASATSVVEPGAVLVVVRSGILRRAIPAAINVVPVALNQDMKALRPRGDLMGTYLLALIEGNQAGLIAEWTKQGATVESIEQVFLANSRVPIPPLPEQAAIVRFLDHADRPIRRAVRAKQKLVVLLYKQRQAIVQRAVTRGLDPNARLKPSSVKWLGDVPEHWEVRRAKYFYREVDDRTTTGQEELLSVSHLTGITPRSQKNITMFMASSYVGHKVCQPGDLVINTMWAWMGALGVSKHMGLVSPSYGVYRPIPETGLLDEYADLLLRTMSYVSEYLIRSTGIRSSRLRLYPEEFLRIGIACPPSHEQRAILSRVTAETADTERAMAGAEAEIALLREFRTRLIADVATGKLDVREAAARLPDEAAEPEPFGGADEMVDAFREAESPDVEAELEGAEA